MNTQESERLINFDGHSISYAFNELDEVPLADAITIHKSQGSEYPCVVIPIAMQHYNLLERNLLYPGVTRGKQMVVFAGQKKAVVMAVKNRQSYS